MIYIKCRIILCTTGVFWNNSITSAENCGKNLTKKVYFLYFLKRGDPDELFKGTDGNFQKLYVPTVRDRHISDVHPDKSVLQVRQCHTGIHFLFVMIQPQLDAVRDFVEVTKFDLFYDVRGNLFNYTHKSDLLVRSLYHTYTPRQTYRQRIKEKIPFFIDGNDGGTERIIPSSPL